MSWNIKNVVIFLKITIDELRSPINTLETRLGERASANVQPCFFHVYYCMIFEFGSHAIWNKEIDVRCKS